MRCSAPISSSAASHLTAGHAARSGDAGADALAGSWEEVARLLERHAAA
ncbi:MAG: hypothetical protein ACK4E5_10825 [Erythrobacter cryptus]